MTVTITEPETATTDVKPWGAVPAALRDDMNIPANAIRVYLLLQSWGGATPGGCWASQGRIAQHFGVNERTIRALLQALEWADWITIQHRGQQDGVGGRETNLYHTYRDQAECRQARLTRRIGRVTKSPDGRKKSAGNRGKKSAGKGEKVSGKNDPESGVIGKNDPETYRKKSSSLYRDGIRYIENNAPQGGSPVGDHDPEGLGDQDDHTPKDQDQATGPTGDQDQGDRTITDHASEQDQAADHAQGDQGGDAIPDVPTFTPTPKPRKLSDHQRRFSALRRGWGLADQKLRANEKAMLGRAAKFLGGKQVAESNAADADFLPGLNPPAPPEEIDEFFRYWAWKHKDHETIRANPPRDVLKLQSWFITFRTDRGWKDHRADTAIKAAAARGEQVQITGPGAGHIALIKAARELHAQMKGIDND